MAAKKISGGVSDSVLKARDEKLKRAGWGQNRSQRLPIKKWDVGVEFEGVLGKVKKLPDKDGKKGGYILFVDTDAGRECYGMPALLLEALDGVEAGARLNVLCTGQVPSNKGNDAWAFDVRVMEEAQ